MNPFYFSLAQRVCFDNESADTPPVEQPSEVQAITPEFHANALSERDATWQAKLDESNGKVAALQAKNDANTISLALDAAAQAGNAVSTDVVRELLATKTRIGPDGQPVVNLGEFVGSVSETIAFMRAQPKYQTLFKADAVSGIGGSNAPRGSYPRTFDIASLSPAQYQKLRRENPRALGFN